MKCLVEACQQITFVTVDRFCLLKLVSTTFYQIFIFSPNGRPLKTMKNVFHFI